MMAVCSRFRCIIKCMLPVDGTRKFTHDSRMTSMLLLAIASPRGVQPRLPVHNFLTHLYQYCRSRPRIALALHKVRSHARRKPAAVQNTLLDTKRHARFSLIPKLAHTSVSAKHNGHITNELCRVAPIISTRLEQKDTSCSLGVQRTVYLHDASDVRAAIQMAHIPGNAHVSVHEQIGIADHVLVLRIRALFVSMTMPVDIEGMDDDGHKPLRHHLMSSATSARSAALNSRGRFAPAPFQESPLSFRKGSSTPYCG